MTSHSFPVLRNYFLKALLGALFVPALANAALPSNAEVEAILARHLVANKQVKGVAVALVDADGIRVVTAGNARGSTPVKPDNVFEIGSITKTFTGLLLAIAQERGESQLDDPVEKFLPDGLRLRDKNGHPIRMVDLVTHRSGLPALASNMAEKSGQDRFTDPYADYTVDHLHQYVQSYSATRARNAQFEYSNIGFGILGYALMRAAKADSFEALLTERILKPLNMLSTTSDPLRFSDRLTQPHSADGTPTSAWHLPTAHAGAGAIRSTAGDMARYIQALVGLNNTPLYAPMTLALTPREDGPGRINRVGLAWLRIPFDQRELKGHDGGTAGSSSSMLVDRASKEGVFIVANTSFRLFDVALHLMDRRHKLEKPEFPLIVALTQDVVGRYSGTYKLTDTMNIVVRAVGNNLTLQATGQGEFPVFAQSETRFFAKVAPIVVTFGDLGGAGTGKAGSFVIEQGGGKRKAVRVE